MAKFIVGREKGGKKLLVKRLAVYGQGIVEEWTSDPAEAAHLSEIQARAVFDELVSDPASCDVCAIVGEKGRAVKVHFHDKTAVKEPEDKLKDFDFGTRPTAVEPAAV